MSLLRFHVFGIVVRKDKNQQLDASSDDIPQCHRAALLCENYLKAHQLVALAHSFNKQGWCTLFWDNPTNTVLLHTQGHQMCIDLLLKTVPSKSTICYYLRKVGWSGQLFTDHRAFFEQWNYIFLKLFFMLTMSVPQPRKD